jgi:hypothetical protein
MLGDGGVSLLVCLSLLSGIVLGLKFNVKLLLLLCLTSVACGFGAAMSGFAGPGHAALMSALAVVALQVGYFVAVVITAMRLTEEPIAVVREAGARDRARDGLETRHP